MSKIISLKDLGLIINRGQSLSPRIRGPGDRKSVLVHGVFDVLHAGHLNYFEEAKKHGHTLIVSITQDKFINKGPGRPYFDTQTRARMLESLAITDFVVISDGPTAIDVIHALKPDVYVKGPDYRDHTKDVTGEITNEIQAIGSYGGRVVYTDTPVFSSSKLVNAFSGLWSDEQKNVIQQIKNLGGYELCEKIINDLSKLKVLVSGEPIIDVYRFVEPQNISSKRPSISARFLYEEKYEGGSLAITNHLKSFCDVKLMTGVHEGRGISKIRYIAHEKSQRIFECTHVNEKYEFAWGISKFSRRMLEQNACHDVTILADFGHGMFENELLDACRDLKGFVGLNVQTNSSNYGFNPFTKHIRFDYLSLDLREARVAFHDNSSEVIQVIERLKSKLESRSFSLTLGPNGAFFKDHTCPAFADKIVDATGAGDAYFAITSLLVKTECDPHVIPFIGNVFAGLKTKIIGNKSAVTKAQLLKTLQSILK